jgi:hypothetical protein
MTVGVEAVDKRVIARYAQGDERCRGRVIGYVPVPAVVIELEDGSREFWRADMCELEAP